MMGDVGLVEINPLFRRQGGLLHVKEVQAVGPVIVRAGDGHVPQLRGQIEAAEGNSEGLFCGNQPAVRLQPGIGRLVLLVARKLLTKQAIMIVQAYAVTGEAQRGDGIQKAGSQAAQAAVAQRGLRFQLLDLVQIPAHG